MIHGHEEILYSKDIRKCTADFKSDITFKLILNILFKFVVYCSHFIFLGLTSAQVKFTYFTLKGVSQGILSYFEHRQNYR